MWGASPMPPTGDLALNPSMCPDWELNQQPFGSQVGTQSTEPHQTGLVHITYIYYGLHVCVPLKFIYRNPSLYYDNIWRWELWEKLGDEGGALMMGLVPS